MAKPKPAFTLMDMEDGMGYKFGASSGPDDAEKRFYSDLRPVLDGLYGLAEKNYLEFVKRKHDKDSGKVATRFLPRVGQSEASIPVWCRICYHLTLVADYRTG